MRQSHLIGLFSVLAVSAAADRPTGPCATVTADDASTGLVYRGKREIHRRSRDRSLKELSGIALQPDDAVPAGFWIWLVDDSKRNVFRADFDGTIGSGDENKIELDTSSRGQLEGLLFRTEDDSLYTVQEGEYEIVRIGLAQGVKNARIEGAYPLSGMQRYATVTAVNASSAAPLAKYLSTKKSSNEGLEGIAYFRGTTPLNRGQGSFFVVKEKNPGLLIEINNSLDAILGFTLLNCGDYSGCSDSEELPFSDRVDGATRDFTGLSFDSRRQKLWITSDKSTAIFLYDVTDRTYSTHPLFTSRFDRCVQQVEGVAYIESVDALAVVSDRQDSAAYFRYDIIGQ